jgi:putative ABC transport system permease protein
MSALTRELRFAVRGLWKTKGFTAVTLLTVALGVGANTAIFSIVHGVLLRPLPFRSPERIVTLWESVPDEAGVPRRWRTTAGDYFDWEGEATTFERMALFGSAGVNWIGDGEPEELLGARVSASYFDVLGIEPILGRTFLPEENVPGNERVLLLSHGLWQRRFGRSKDVLGRSLLLDGERFEIVGVMPEAVYPTWPQATGRLPFLPLYQQIWVPMALSEERKQNRGSHVFGAIARLAPGSTLESARAEMDTIASRLAAASPDNYGKGIVVVPYLEEVTGSARPALLVLWGAVALVLLIACANIASLLLARSAARQKEVALRTALGASRARVLGQFLCESSVLGVFGGALGVGLAYLGVNVLVGLSPAAVPRLADSGMSVPVLAFALLISLLTGVLFGLAPAIQMSRPDLSLRLKERGPRVGLRRGLVVSELALAMVLVVGATLLLQSFVRLRRMDLGFQAEGVLLSEVNLPPSQYRDFRSIARFHRALLQRLSSVSGIVATGLTYDHPLDSNWIDDFAIEGAPETEETLSAALRIVSPDYFRTMGTGILRGRPFTALDDADHPGAVIVNEAFVERYLTPSSTLVKRLVITTPRGYGGESLPTLFEIVGVVENVQFLGPAVPPEPAFYLPAAQFPVQEMMVAVKVASDPAAFAARLREEVWAVDPDIPLSNITTMGRLLSEALAQPRFNAVVLGFFGATALALAGLGIYGVLSTTVAQRTSEIGIRMALGARSGDVVRMVVRQGMRLTFAGLTIGLLAALASTPVLRSLLFGVGTMDPWTFAFVAAFLASVALFASYIPARRASFIEPLTALRHE